MSEEHAAWRNMALQIYRLARLDLLKPRPAPSSVEEQFLLEEVYDALADLKEATIADDEGLAWRYGDEVLALLAELRRIWWSEGES